MYPGISVAPMVDWTDRHFRYFLRLLAPKSLFYTEMRTTGAILYGNEDHILAFDPAEKPLSLQIAGNHCRDIARSIHKAEAWPYDEYNLNCGCPSSKVQHAQFGACLMENALLVADLIKAMKDSTIKPVTVKHRIGIKRQGYSQENYEDLRDFVGLCRLAGADRVIVHARIAILDGLDPKQNRDIPPLRYADVWKLKEDFPDFPIEINGGIRDLDQMILQLQKVDGVMIGRAAYESPYLMTEIERWFFKDPLSYLTRRWVLEHLFDYFRFWEKKGLMMHKIYRHMTALFSGFPYARRWRQLLSSPHKTFPYACALLEEGLKLFPSWILDSTDLQPKKVSVLALGD